MTLTQYVDLPNAFQVFKKVKQVLKDQSKEEEKQGSSARLRQFIQERGLATDKTQMSSHRKVS